MMERGEKGVPRACCYIRKQAEPREKGSRAQASMSELESNRV